MANSGYYYNQYISFKNDVSKYDKSIKELSKIKDSLINDFTDEQRNVNQELNDLQDDLKKSVRHDTKYITIANESELYKEKSTMTDANLRGSVQALDNEIASLNAQKSRAEQNRDSSYQSYTREKQAEYQAWLDSLKKLL